MLPDPITAIGDTTRKLAFNPDFMPEIGVSSDILDADILISLPKFKTHGLTVMTGAKKQLRHPSRCPEGQAARACQIARTVSPGDR